jgi:hypothetical protein
VKTGAILARNRASNQGLSYFFDPSLNLLNPALFGAISTELIPADRTQGSRWIELGLRVSF